LFLESLERRKHALQLDLIIAVYKSLGPLATSVVSAFYDGYAALVLAQF
jgi:hypothetical protein